MRGAAYSVHKFRHENFNRVFILAGPFDFGDEPSELARRDHESRRVDTDVSRHAWVMECSRVSVGVFKKTPLEVDRDEFALCCICLRRAGGFYAR